MLPDLISRPFPESPARNQDFFADFQRSMNRLMRDFFQDFSSSSDLMSASQEGMTNFVPRLDLEDLEDRISLSAELPGLTEQDIQVEINRDLLTIKGEKRSDKEGKDGGRCFSERSYGVFERSVRLPAAIDIDKVMAKFSNGILNIELPKAPDARKDVKKIPIKH